MSNSGAGCRAGSEQFSSPRGAIRARVRPPLNGPLTPGEPSGNRDALKRGAARGLCSAELAHDTYPPRRDPGLFSLLTDASGQPTGPGVTSALGSPPPWQPGESKTSPSFLAAHTVGPGTESTFGPPTRRNTAGKTVHATGMYELFSLPDCSAGLQICPARVSCPRKWGTERARSAAPTAALSIALLSREGLMPLKPSTSAETGPALLDISACAGQTWRPRSCVAPA